MFLLLLFFLLKTPKDPWLATGPKIFTMSTRLYPATEEPGCPLSSVLRFGLQVSKANNRSKQPADRPKRNHTLMEVWHRISLSEISNHPNLHGSLLLGCLLQMLRLSNNIPVSSCSNSTTL